MEQSEIDELQAYINLYFKNKKIITMPQTFYVIVNNKGEYLIGFDRRHNPLFGSDINQAEWSFDEQVVQNYIDENNIEDARTQPTEGANHPPKPPISA